MSLADWLKDKFGMGGGINRLNVETLNAERIQLEELQRVEERELDQVEQQRNELIQKGRSQTNPRQKLALARKVKSLDDAARGKDQHLAILNQRLQLICGLLEIKKRAKVLPNSVLNSVPTEELIVMVETASETGQFEWERFGEVLDEMGRASSWGVASETDPAIEAIMAEMEAGSSENAEPPAEKEGPSKRADKFAAPDRHDPERI